jgi:hypothetical protein
VTDEANIQFKTTRTATDGHGFAGDQLVPTVEFDYCAIDGVDVETVDSSSRSNREAILRFSQFMARDNVPPEEIGLRFLAFMHIAYPDGTQRQLAKRMGLDESNASRRVREMRQLMRSASL